MQGLRRPFDDGEAVLFAGGLISAPIDDDKGGELPVHVKVERTGIGGVLRAKRGHKDRRRAERLFQHGSGFGPAGNAVHADLGHGAFQCRNRGVAHFRQARHVQSLAPASISTLSDAPPDEAPAHGRDTTPEATSRSHATVVLYRATIASFSDTSPEVRR